MPTAAQTRADRKRLDALDITVLRSLARKGPGHGMKGVGRADKSEIVNYLMVHPTLRPSPTDIRPSVPQVAPPAPMPALRPARPAIVAAAPQRIPPAIAAEAQARNRMYMPIPPEFPPVTIAEQIARDQMTWEALNAELHLEPSDYDSDDSLAFSYSDIEVYGTHDGARDEKRRVSASYLGELNRRSAWAIAEAQRRRAESASVERLLLGRARLSAAVLATRRAQEQARESYWAADDAKRAEIWQDEDRRRHEVWRKTGRAGGVEFATRDIRKPVETRRRVAESARFERQLMAPSPLGIALAELRRQANLRELAWQAEDVRREQFWDGEDQERLFALEDKLEASRGKKRRMW